MNREILFRGKRKNWDDKLWVYGGIDYSKECFYIHTVNNICFEVVPETVGQSTGLFDKNGKRIFEGDIYHQGDKNITYTVVWHDTGFIGKQNGTSSYAGLLYWINRIEVIGNTHDSPELL